MTDDQIAKAISQINAVYAASGMSDAEFERLLELARLWRTLKESKSNASGNT